MATLHGARHAFLASLALAACASGAGGVRIPAIAPLCHAGYELFHGCGEVTTVAIVGVGARHFDGADPRDQREYGEALLHLRDYVLLPLLGPRVPSLEGWGLGSACQGPGLAVWLEVADAADVQRALGIVGRALAERDLADEVLITLHPSPRDP